MSNTKTMNRNKIIYWVFTGFFAFSMLSGAGMYLFNYEHATENFTRLGFPVWLILPLAFAKIVGIASILQNKSPLLREWAYAAFFFNLALAAGAHVAAHDGEAFGPLLVLGAMLGSYFYSKKVSHEKA